MLMHINSLHAEINLPPARSGEGQCSLAPYCKVPAHVVDEYPACPDDWMHGSDKASSYFIGVDEGREMWFDFEANYVHTHHVAVVISVQGVNPVTDKPISKLCLIQHKGKCPTHDIDFQQDRFCPKCEHKWPAQNYLATTTGKQFWLDGFWNGDGEIRQYLITPEIAKGVAAQVEKMDPKFERVWSIGFAFYLSVDPKPAPKMDGMSRSPLGNGMVLEASDGNLDLAELGGDSLGFGASNNCSPTITTTPSPENTVWFSPAGQKTISPNVNNMHSANPAANSASYECKTGSPMGETKALTPVPHKALKSRRYKSSGIGASSAAYRAAGPAAPVQKVAITKKFEIGGGVRVGQEIGVDPNPIEFWQPEPAGMVYVNYVAPEFLSKIIEAGKREEKTSPLDDMQVGN